MKAKHTPGPWVAEPSPESRYFYWYVRGKRFSVGLNTENSEANARLIAAAPDLLEQLQLLAQSVRHMKGFELAVADADAAIAKATGA